jgi:hypothetical protein
MDAFAWALVFGTFAMVFLASLGVMVLLLPIAAAKAESCKCPWCREFVYCPGAKSVDPLDLDHP